MTRLTIFISHVSHSLLPAIDIAGAQVQLGASEPLARLPVCQHVSIYGYIVQSHCISLCNCHYPNLVPGCYVNPPFA